MLPISQLRGWTHTELCETSFKSKPVALKIIYNVPMLSWKTAIDCHVALSGAPE